MPTEVLPRPLPSTGHEGDPHPDRLRTVIAVLAAAVVAAVIVLIVLSAMIVAGSGSNEVESSGDTQPADPIPSIVAPTLPSTAAADISTTENQPAGNGTTEAPTAGGRATVTQPAAPQATNTAQPTDRTGSTTATSPAATAVAGPGTEPCSASGVDSWQDQPGLPGPVAAKRAAILQAATACDLDRLVSLTGTDFTAGLGGGDAATLWPEMEANGEAPLLFLAQLLTRPHGTMESEGGTFYVWPTAFLYDSWADVPAADRDMLAGIYDEFDFDAFESAGGYAGFRIAIHESGSWVYFIGGV